MSMVRPLDESQGALQLHGHVTWLVCGSDPYDPHDFSMTRLRLKVFFRNMSSTPSVISSPEPSWPPTWHGLTLKEQCKPHGLCIILGESCSKLLLYCTKWSF